MIAKEITFHDLDGNKLTEKFYFGLTQNDLTKLKFSYKEGFEEHINNLLAKDDKSEIYRTFIDVILMSYGEKSEDGRRFIKSPEISEAFSQMDAFDVLLEEISTDENAMADFFIGIMPPSLENRIDRSLFTNN